MKPNWRTAHKSVREQIERLLEQSWKMADGRMSAAQSWKQAADLAWANGCDIEPPATPASDKIAELRTAGDFRTLNRLYMLQGLDIEAAQEKANVVRWQAMRKWAAEPSNAERQAADLQRAEAEAVAAQVEARAMAIVAEQNRAALEKARAVARREIEAQR
jgi:hypothetical protein